MSESSIANEVQKSVREKRPMTIGRILGNEYFLYCVSMVGFFVIWHVVAKAQWLGSSLATPAEVIETFDHLIETKLAGRTLWGHVWASTRRILIGFVLASIIAIPLGLFMALNRYVNTIVKPVFDIFKPMPPIAWISIAILWFGIGEPSKIFIIVIGTFVPCLLNAYNGIRLIEPELYDVVRVLGGNRRAEIFQGQFPGFLPGHLRRPADIPVVGLDLRDRGGTGQRPLRPGLDHHSRHEAVQSRHGYRRHGHHCHRGLDHRHGHNRPGKIALPLEEGNRRPLKADEKERFDNG